MQDKTLLSSKETAELLGVGVSTLYRYKKLSDFPKPIFFTNVTKRYKKDEVEAFINKRQNEGRPLPQGGERWTPINHTMTIWAKRIFT